MSKRTLLEQVIAACKKAFYFVTGFSFIINALMLIVPIYMLQIFDRVLASHSFETLIYLTIIALLGLLLFALLDIARSRVLIIVSRWLDEKLSPEALKNSADYSLQNKSDPMQVLKDVTQIRQFLGGSGIIAVLDAPWVPIYLLVIFLLQPLLGLIALVGAILLFSIALLVEKYARGMQSEANKLAVDNQSHINKAINNVESLQAMGMLNNVVNRWLNANKKVTSIQATMSRRGTSLLSISKLLRLSLQIIMLGTGAYLVIAGSFTAGAMIAATILLSRALAPVEQSISGWQQLIETRQAYARLKRFFSLPETRPIKIELPKPKGKLQVENLYYSISPKTKPILNNVNFALNPGEFLVVIGPSAAGKSTLARLCVGAWQATSGVIRLDGANVYEWERDNFGQHVGYVPQVVDLLPGTIKENISRFSDANDEDIIAAAKAADVHEMILQLPNGYETVLDQVCSQLSGGQRQRIALARALFGNPKFVVLDEPNANLDKVGERALIDALKSLKKSGVTLIVISHSTAIATIADKLLFLNKGKQVAFGNAHDVLEMLKTKQAPQEKAGGEHASN